ncbi:MAG: hypothetical protein K6A63_01770 [Acholeplasmatales bacterium]|nr:hypothetical protein [Acholeplasmatales bacterium]
MFGILSKGFINNIHDAFNDIGYHENNNYSHDLMQKKTIESIIDSKNISEATGRIYSSKYILNNEKKINNIFNKKLNYWNSLGWDKNNINLDNKNIYHITNAFGDIRVFNEELDNNSLIIKSDSKEIFINHHVLSRASGFNKASLLVNDKLVGMLKIDNKRGLVIENNDTQYHIIEDDEGVNIYYQSDINKLAENEDIEKSKRIALISTGIVDMKYGYARIEVFNDLVNIEFLYLVAIFKYEYDLHFTKTKKAVDSIINSL